MSVIDAGKKVVAGFKKTLAKIANAMRFFATQVGFIVALLIIVVFIVVALAVLIKTLDHAIGKWLDAEYAGISTDGDYNYIVSSIGYAGYDSLVTEKLWQEYMAYEYSVLMDVAEYLYQGQTEWEKDKSNGIVSGDSGGPFAGEEVISPEYLPYIPVIAEYDLSQMTHENWQKAVIEGQGSARFGFTNPADVGVAGTGYTSIGGNRSVLSPMITYEFKDNPYEEEVGSLVPYITVLKEALEYHYFSVGAEGENGGRVNYGPGGMYSENPENTGVMITEENIEDVNLLEINEQLNMENMYLPRSTNSADRILEGSNPDSLNSWNEGNWPVADSLFPQALYYTNDYATVTYKMPLQTLIDRFLPKASLLTSWYLIKDTDMASDEMKGTDSTSESVSTDKESAFDVESLMKDIKSIYNYYCWLDESISYEGVETVQYDEKGNVVRDDEGNAQLSTEEKPYSPTNNETFIKFGQVGLETNRFGVFEFYEPAALGAAAPKAPTHVTHMPDEATVPIVINLLSDNAHFLEDYTLDVEYEYTYDYTYTASNVEIDITLTSDEIEDRNIVLGTSTIIINGKSYKMIRCNYSFSRDCYDITYIGTGRVTKTIEATGSFDAEYDKNSVGNAYGTSGDPDNATDAEKDGWNLSDALYNDAIKDAEEEIQKNPTIQEAEKYAQEVGEVQLVNYEWLYPLLTSETDAGDVNAKHLDDIRNYDQLFAFYNFTVASGEMEPEEIMALLTQEIFEASEVEGETDGTRTNDILEDMAESDAESEAGDPPGYPSGGTVSNIEVKSIDVKGYEEEPFYKVVSSYPKEPTPQNAVYDIKEETIALTMDVPQKRMSAMLILTVESWSKSATYDNHIVQNSFNPDNYRYVIPHSFFAFGLRVFQINEEPTYRVTLYDKYFSHPDDPEKAAIKEADVLAMLLKWEEYGNTGNESAYVFMRDLYKLIMYIRDSGGVLEAAYSYLYLPDSIWDFREGITQEAWWTERLAADLYGDDAISEEDNIPIVKKNELSWQIVEYEDYEECQNGDTASAYALFPFGSPYTRAWFMENAIEEGRFDDGNYKEGHGGADWYSRRLHQSILDQEEGVFSDIYSYELKRMTLQNIMKESGTQESLMNKAISFLNSGGDDTLPAYQQAKQELDAQLDEYTVKAPIVSVATGYVTKASYNCYGGFSVGIVHMQGDADSSSPKFKTTYAHMRRWPEVQAGDIVGPGTIIGYEGTTGNSGGVHLHMGVQANGEPESPAKYMGPVFTPFYNKEKANEILSTYQDDQRLALSSDYFSLIRTALLARFNGSRFAYTDGSPLSTGQAILLSTATFVESGDREYIMFPEPSGDETQLIRQGNSVVVKVGVTNPEYWLCNVQRETVTDSSAVAGTNSDDNYNYYSSTTKVLLKVLSKQRISASDVNLDSVSVKTSKTGSEGTQIVWGNNLPIYPYADDYTEAYDINLLNTQKIFEVDPSEYEGDDSASIGEHSPDVRAVSDFFDISKIGDRLKIPNALLLRLADINNPYAVPFYDAAVSEGHQGALGGVAIGQAGTLSGDLRKLQISLKAQGFDSGDLMNTSGEFDSYTAEAVSEMAGKLRGSGFGSYANPGAEGAVGEFYGVGEFNIKTMVAYNAYVTYGTYSNAIQAGKLGLALAATQTGLPYNFLCGVASCESGFLPTNESMEFAVKPYTVSWADPNTESPPLVEYRGVKRIVRRAQGLMQLTIGTAFWRCGLHGITNVEQIVAMVRTPASNALLGAEYLRDNIVTIESDPELFNWVKEVSSSGTWAQLGRESHTSALKLLEYAMSAIMYNKGPGAINNYLGQLAGMTYTVSGGTYSVNTNGAGYSANVLNMILNGAPADNAVDGNYGEGGLGNN